MPGIQAVAPDSAGRRRAALGTVALVRTGDDGHTGEAVTDHKALLDSVAEELLAMGLGEGGDFYVTGRENETAQCGGRSSEHVGISYAEGAFHVWYFDMGRTRELLVTEDWAAAREAFVEHATVLAGGRGRGPKANPPQTREQVASIRAARTRVTERFASLADELAASGLADSGAFYLPGDLAVPTGGDYVGLTFRAGSFHAWRMTPTHRQELVVTDDFDEARRVFIAEGTALAQGGSA